MEDSDRTVVLDNSSTPPDYGPCPICGTKLESDPNDAGTLRCPACRFMQKQRSAVVPGGTVGGKYRILSHLDSGGNGDIFICHPLADVSQRYVLKVLKRSDSVSRKRFQREAQILSELGHIKQIVKTIDFWEEDGALFFIMEYVRGKNLRQIKQEYEFDETATLQVAQETVEALRYIWETYSVIHRDIKPENIMLDEEFRLKIMDFGLSKQCDEAVDTGITVEHIGIGTPGYMSPEQFEDSKHVDFRSDIFSLGATLFFLLTGEKPFAGRAPIEIYQNTLANSPPPDERFGGHCSVPCMRLIQKMMRVRPEERYQSYAELQADIDKLLG